MKKLIVTLFGIFFITNSVLADGHVKRIISTSETGMGNEIVYPSGKAMVVAIGVEGQKIMTPVK